MNNYYGELIRRRWTAIAPTSAANLEDPDTFFSELGETIAARTEQLAATLAGPDPAGESYLQKIGRQQTARKQAEEVTLAEVPWPDPEMIGTDLRAEWEATLPSEESLAKWAFDLEGKVYEDQLQEQAQDWALPIEFLQELVTSSNPWTYLQEHSTMMRQARERLYARYLAER
jgi:hypothetical protein